MGPVAIWRTYLFCEFFVQSFLLCGSPDPRSVSFGQIDHLPSGVALLTIVEDKALHKAAADRAISCETWKRILSSPLEVIGEKLVHDTKGSRGQRIWCGSSNSQQLGCKRDFIRCVDWGLFWRQLCRAQSAE
jgi:hypothetical protein